MRRILVLLLWMGANAFAQAPTQIIAVVEEFEGDAPTAANEAASSNTPAISNAPASSNAPALVTQLRATFAKTAAGWRSVCRIAGLEGERRDCAPAELDQRREWVALAAGKRATIATRGWYQPERPMMLGMLNIVDGAVPRSGVRSSEFAGWMGGEFEAPVLALAHPALLRATDWKRATLGRDDLALATKALADSIGEVPGCNPDQPGPKLAPQHLISRTAWASSRGERLFSVSLNRKLLGDCDRPPSIEWSDFLFYAPARGQPTLINLGYTGAHAVRVGFVAIGDFDGDGKAELLLWRSTINEDGYVLLFDGFAKGVKGAWNYH